MTITPQVEWQSLLKVLEQERRGSIYVLGAVDRGKSTLCRYMRERLAPLVKVAYLDCDSGQSVIGPPTALGLALYSGSSPDPVSIHLRFAGSVSPQGCMLQFVCGARRLLDKAREEGARVCIIDSPGFVKGGIAREFQFQMIDLLQPDHLVAIQDSDEVEGILANFRQHPAMQIHRFSVSLRTVARTPEWRKAYRDRHFRKYFSQVEIHEIPLRGLGLHGRLPGLNDLLGWHNLLVAFCDWEGGVISLGIVERFDPDLRTLRVIAPPFDRKRLSAVQVGSFTLDMPLRT
jgi:polynucleotide 5'-hydroxyl-kinase GRC3/NOL9